MPHLTTPPRKPARPLLTTLLTALLAGCTATPSAHWLPRGTVAGDRVHSPFYDWRETLPTDPGRMLRIEPLPAQPEFTAASVQQRILYTSADVRWNAGILPVSGTLYLPKGTTPPGGWPIVAWAHGTLGVADACAPSWTLHRPRDATYLNRWLAQGFAVVATDYQGLGGPGPHPYLFWEAEGRSVLDSVRAALAAYPAQLANNIIITGQSQGSGSAIGASRIAASYAPDLRLRATIATGVVSSFPNGPVPLPDMAANPAGPTRFTVLRLVGGSLRDAAPSADLLMSDKGRHLLAMARETCVDEMRGHEQQQGLNMGNAFSVPLEQLTRLLRPTTDMSPVRLPMPVFLGTGLADRTIPPLRQYAAAAALCQAGSSVQWKTYAGTTHNGIVNAAFEDEVTFVRRALAGLAADSNCGQLQEPGAPGVATPGIRFND